MAVPHGHGDRLMAERLLHFLQGPPALHEPRREGVAEVVEAEALECGPVPLPRRFGRRSSSGYRRRSPWRLGSSAAPGRRRRSSSTALRGACRSWSAPGGPRLAPRSEEHTSELQSLTNLVCRLLLEKKNTNT